MAPTESKTNSRFLQRCINTDCATTFDISQRLYVCSNCGGLLDIENTQPIEDATILRDAWRDRKGFSKVSDRSGVWRFRELLPFDPDLEVVSLLEGNTPLYDAPRAASFCNLDSLKLKHQGANPTGSFKDTGMTTAVTQAVALGSRVVVCASTGNTAASLAAYAARADLVCAILVPEGQISHAKLAQALDYGARVLELAGNFDSCMRVLREVSDDPSIYLVNSINPFRIEGQKTVAAELAEQLNWNVPDHLVVPGGNLGNSSAFGKGFRDLLAAGLIERLPRISVVQAEGAAPFARMFEDMGDQLIDDEHPHTLASAIKIGAPISWPKALRAVLDSDGKVLTVSEQEIADAKAIIGRDGIGCEPASATTVAGIRRLVERGFIKNDESVVAVLTGHLLKDTDYVIKYHNNNLEASWLPADSKRITGRFRNEPERVSVEGVRDVLAGLAS
jgi:threonine synthase